MAKGLHIAEDLTLPLELVTSTQAILARKRSGKSYTASVQAEELLEQKQQILVIDPTSAWWGLRTSADGKSSGYPVAVFGGDHADVPLDFRAGKAKAAAVVEHGFSAIFDIGNFHTGEQLQFVADLCSELLRINRKALHVFMDEADTFAPQKPGSVLANKCLGTVSRLVKQGGIRGIGFTMITQRSASINWDVLSQVDLLTVLRMSAPHDLNPVRGWLQSETTKEFAQKVYDELPRLPVGTAFIASAPLKLAQRVQIRTRRTFNSGATPKPGERHVEPTVMAKVDIAKLGEKIAASVKTAHENSPDTLKARIAALEKQLAKPQAATGSAPREITDREKAAILKPFVDERRTIARDLERLHKRVNHLIVSLIETRDQVSISINLATANLPTDTTSAETVRAIAHPKTIPAPARSVSTSGTASLRKASRSILTVLAQFGESSRNKVAAISGYSVTSGSFRNTLSECRTGGWLTGSDPINITDAGIEALGSYEPLPTGPALFAQWQTKLTKAAREILTCVADGPHTREQIGEATGYSSASGSFRNALSELRTLELIQRGDPIALHPDFSEAIRD